jgi:hypothetical protein
MCEDTRFLPAQLYLLLHSVALITVRPIDGPGLGIDQARIDPHSPAGGADCSGQNAVHGGVLVAPMSGLAVPRADPARLAADGNKWHASAISAVAPSRIMHGGRVTSSIASLRQTIPPPLALQDRPLFSPSSRRSRRFAAYRSRRDIPGRRSSSRCSAKHSATG